MGVLSIDTELSLLLLGISIDDSGCGTNAASKNVPVSKQFFNNYIKMHLYQIHDMILVEVGISSRSVRKGRSL